MTQKFPIMTQKFPAMTQKFPAVRARIRLSPFTGYNRRRYSFASATRKNFHRSPAFVPRLYVRMICTALQSHDDIFSAQKGGIHCPGRRPAASAETANRHDRQRALRRADHSSSVVIVTMLAEHESCIHGRRNAQNIRWEGRPRRSSHKPARPPPGRFEVRQRWLSGLRSRQRAPERASGPARQLPTDVDSAITDAFAGTDACEQSLSTRNFPIRYLVKGTRKGPRNLGSMTDATSRQRDGAFVRAAAARKS